MLARRVEYGSVGDVRPGLRLFEDRIVPAWRRAHGYRMSHVSLREGTDVVVVFGYWNTEEDERAARAHGAELGAGLERAWGAADPVARTYDVAVLVRPALQPEQGTLMRNVHLGDLSAAAIDATVAAFEERYVAELAGRPGFAWAALHLHRQTGTAIAASYWSDAAQLHRADPVLDRFCREVSDRGVRVTTVRLTRLLFIDAPPGVIT